MSLYLLRVCLFMDRKSIMKEPCCATHISETHTYMPKFMA